METECAREYCHNVIQQVPGVHRQRKYCSDGCRMEAYRDRHRTYKSSPFDQFGFELSRELKASGIEFSRRQQLADAIECEIDRRVELRTKALQAKIEATEYYTLEAYNRGHIDTMERINQHYLHGSECPYSGEN